MVGTVVIMAAITTDTMATITRGATVAMLIIKIIIGVVITGISMDIGMVEGAGGIIQDITMTQIITTMQLPHQVILMLLQ